MSFLGFPIWRYIDLNDLEEITRVIRLTDPNVLRWLFWKSQKCTEMPKFCGGLGAVRTGIALF